MKSTFQDRLLVIVAPLCTAVAIGWTLIPGDQNGRGSLVVDELAAERAADAVPTTLAITPAPMQREVAPAAPAADDAPSAAAEQALDSTVGDYSHPDPLPTEMLRSSYEAATLGLVDPQEQLASAVQVLDSTVGDYSQPDPLPAEMLRRSYQAATLGLVHPHEQLASVVRVSAKSTRVAGDVD